MLAGELGPDPEVETGWSQSWGPSGLNELLLAINLSGSSLKLLPVNQITIDVELGYVYG